MRARTEWDGLGKRCEVARLEASLHDLGDGRVDVDRLGHLERQRGGHQKERHRAESSWTDEPREGRTRCGEKVARADESCWVPLDLYGFIRTVTT